MPRQNLEEKSIRKIKEKNNASLQEERADPFELKEPAGIYKLSDRQKEAIKEAKEQIKKLQTLTNKEANNEIDEWLEKE